MKNELLTRWLQLTEKWRWLSLFGLLAGATLAMAQFCLTPTYRAGLDWQKQAAQQQAHYQQRLAPLWQPPSLQALQARNQQLLDELVSKGEPFSLYTLLERSGGELDQWHPGAQESQFQLWLEWPQLKRLFSYLLACDPAPLLTSFIVQHKAERLYATFHLRFDHDHPVE